MKNLTERELANALDETDLIDDFEDCRELARAAAQALGVPLAPEPKAEPAEEWPGWWGYETFPSAPGALGSEMVKIRAVDLRALIAAYEAARKAGVLPGLEAQKKESTDKEWVERLLKEYGEAIGWHPTACHPNDVELAQRARAALEWAEPKQGKAGHRECLCNLCQILRILRGQQSASGREGE